MKNLKQTFLVSLFTLSLILFPLISQAVNVESVPNPRAEYGGWVTDMADILSADTESQLNTMIGELEAENGAEIAVVTVPDTEPYNSPKDFTTRLFNHWGIGKAEEDNGILLMISEGDRRVEIETGYGMEAILPDAKVGNILDAHILTHLKDNDFDTGVLEGTKAIIATIRAEAASGNMPTSQPQPRPVSSVSSPKPLLKPTQQNWLVGVGMLSSVLAGISLGVVWKLKRPTVLKAGEKQYNYNEYYRQKVVWWLHIFRVGSGVLIFGLILWLIPVLIRYLPNHISINSPFYFFLLRSQSWLLRGNSAIALQLIISILVLISVVLTGVEFCPLRWWYTRKQRGLIRRYIKTQQIAQFTLYSLILAIFGFSLTFSSLINKPIILILFGCLSIVALNDYFWQVKSQLIDAQWREQLQEFWQRLSSGWWLLLVPIVWIPILILLYYGIPLLLGISWGIGYLLYFIFTLSPLSSFSISIVFTCATVPLLSRRLGLNTRYIEANRPISLEPIRSISNIDEYLSPTEKVGQSAECLHIEAFKSFEQALKSLEHEPPTLVIYPLNKNLKKAGIKHCPKCHELAVTVSTKEDHETHQKTCQT